MHGFFLTCEHASNAIPPRYEPYFNAHAPLLKSHRGWDPGALPLAKLLAGELRAPLTSGTHSRLLVDLNRTEDNHGVFSEITRRLSGFERENLLARFHRPHWEKVFSELKRRKNVIHVGVHSFTPVFHGHKRSTGIGLLYDPAKPMEDKFCRALQSTLRKLLAVPVHRNLPYRGTGNGLISSLREQKLAGYVSVELEVNNHLAQDKTYAKSLGLVLAAAMRDAAKHLT
ncbi:MAG: N-formylglutamate amidohydrolase [Bdellovibrionota bacterium]